MTEIEPGTPFKVRYHNKRLLNRIESPRTLIDVFMNEVLIYIGRTTMRWNGIELNVVQFLANGSIIVDGNDHNLSIDSMFKEFERLDLKDSHDVTWNNHHL